ncbi:hypothetical protein Tco_1080307 [Tanacetum coccineum]|uniref:Uncharacterized protein n=1 Tax=Tanacetum coccineum TaxID=301880 RepID=A0ABQ5HW43_9ASTR
MLVTIKLFVVSIVKQCFKKRIVSLFKPILRTLKRKDADEGMEAIKATLEHVDGMSTEYKKVLEAGKANLKLKYWKLRKISVIEAEKKDLAKNLELPDEDLKARPNAKEEFR